MSQFVDTSHQWIVERSGIHERRYAAPGELTSDLGIAAAKNALDDAKLTGNDLDLIVLATATPDRTFPATAVRLQAALGMKAGAAFDVQAVCTGFVYALATANAFVVSGQAKRALVVGAETFSRILDFEDRTTCVLFGDGAGALVLEADEGDGTNADSGVLSTSIYSDGTKENMLYVDGGPSSTKSVGHLRMVGRDVFKHAVVNLSSAVENTLAKHELEASDIDWFVPHQANQRIINGVAKKVGISEDSVVSTVAHHANTSSASIPLALDTAVKDGRIKTGQLVMLEAMGGGFTWGSALLRM